MKKLIHIFLLFSFSLSGCGITPIPLFTTEISEYTRITSPDGLVDAIVMYRDSGVATSGSYLLYILTRGGVVEEESEKSNKPVFVGEKVEQLKFSWIKDKDLQIDCKKARIWKFSNFWFSKDVQDYNYIVEIRIAPTCRL
jgi:hypothetical protein